MKKIVIIGGWPAGMMTAASILEHANDKNFEIILLEANKKLGRKLVISGGGRCNVTTGIYDKKILKEKYTRGFNFFEKILGKFSPKKTKKWFENHWLPLKIEPDNRVFPVSDNGNDVLEVFEKIFTENKNNVKIFFETKVMEITRNEEKFFIKTTKDDIEADIVVVATGGNVYRQTGSTGDGYDFAKKMGHTITKLWPSLSSFLIAEDFLKEISGATFSRAKLFFDDKTIVGSLLLTHFGISGPLAFMLSSHLAWDDIREKKVFFMPDSELDFVKWNEILKENFSAFPKRKLFAILSEKLPKKFAEIIIEKFFSEIKEKFVGEISKNDREKIAKILGNGMEITLLDRRPWDEFVTAGGVETSEIDSETLESKLVENLYFVGEILNIDGYTGGFSLQICWATGYEAGRDISEKI